MAAVAPAGSAEEPILLDTPPSSPEVCIIDDSDEQATTTAASSISDTEDCSDGETTNSLSYLFNTIRSPAPIRRIPGGDPFLNRLIEKVWYGKEALYLKSEMHAYQKRSVVKMLLMECGQEEGNGLGGGILAEDMGLGKTLICIGLILTNLYTTTPPPISVRHLAKPVLKKDHTLREMAAKMLTHTVHHYEIPEDGIAPGVASALRENSEVFYEHSELITKSSRAAQDRVLTKTVHMSHATIVVCPPNLVTQWASEFKKHVEEGALKILILRSQGDALPPADKLLDYDVLLFSKTRFDDEARDGKDEKGRRSFYGIQRACECPYIGATRTKICTCFSENQTYASPLFHIHWRRLIVDEGHSMAGNSFAADVASKLLVTARWVVSGTPTRNLIGAGLGSGVAADEHDLARVRALIGDFLGVQQWAGKNNRAWKQLVQGMRANDKAAVKELKEILRTYFVRHRVAEVEMDVVLPPLRHETVYLDPGYFEKLSLNLFASAIHTNAVTSEREGRNYLFHPSQKEHLRLLTHNLLSQSTFFWTGHTPDDVLNALEAVEDYQVKIRKREAAGLGPGIDPHELSMLENTQKYGAIALNNDYWRCLAETHEMGYFTMGTPRRTFEFWRWDGLRNAESEMLLGRALQEMRKFVGERDWRTEIKEEGEVYANPDHVVAGKGISFSIGFKNSLKPVDKKVGSSKVDRNEVKKPRGRKRKQADIREGQSVGLKDDDPSTTTTTTPSTQPTSQKGILPHDSILRQASIIGITSTKLSYLLSRLLPLHRTSTEKILIFYENENLAWYISESLELLSIPHTFYTKSLSTATRAARLMEFNELPPEKCRVMLMDLHQAAHGLNVTSASRIFFMGPVWEPAVEAQAIKRAHRIGQTREVIVETLVLRNTIEESLLKRRWAVSKEDAAAASAGGGLGAVGGSLRRSSGTGRRGGVLEDGVMRKLIAEMPFLELDEDEEMFTPWETPVPVFGWENTVVETTSGNIEGGGNEVDLENINGKERDSTEKMVGIVDGTARVRIHDGEEGEEEPPPRKKVRKAVRFASEEEEEEA